MTKLEKQILEIIRKNNYPDGENDDDQMCAKEIVDFFYFKLRKEFGWGFLSGAVMAIIIVVISNYI